jgi:hypothetical protein
MRSVLLGLYAFVAVSAPAQAKNAQGPVCSAETLHIPVCAAYNAYIARKVQLAVPGASGLGKGQADCSFYVFPGGRITNLSCNGTNDAHASLLKEAIARPRLKSPPGPRALYSQTVQFH